MVQALEKHQEFDSKGPVLLIIMDGVGIGNESGENAAHMAETPNIDRLFSEPLFTKLHAHGTHVGLPSDSDMGNSEIGHNVMGAGRVFAQGAKLVNEAFESGLVFQQETWEKILERGKSGGSVHFVGLFSDANVHSNIDHLYQMLDKLNAEGVKSARVHALLDGRDVGEKTALEYTEPAEKRFEELREKGMDVCFASGGGRMNVTMDRYDADWTIVERGWNAHVQGKARDFKSIGEAVQTMYDEGMVDQYLDAFVIVDENDQPKGKMQDGDAVVLINFRGDRAIELSRAFDEGEGFDKFDRGDVPDLFYAGMMEYDSDQHIPLNSLVVPPPIEGCVSEYMCASGIRSYAISETQKYGHVTYFWNGNRSGMVDEKLEKYCEIPSDKITFDKKPEMKAREITEEVIKAIDSGEFDFLRINFANGDMVGHTGVLDAAIEAMVCVDECVGILVEKMKAIGGTTVVTADHGNADIMYTEKNGERKPMTSHTLNPVPLVVLPAPDMPSFEIKRDADISLGNLASTLLHLLGYRKPDDYLDNLLMNG